MPRYDVQFEVKAFVGYSVDAPTEEDAARMVEALLDTSWCHHSLIYRASEALSSGDGSTLFEVVDNGTWRRYEPIDTESACRYLMSTKAAGAHGLDLLAWALSDGSGVGHLAYYDREVGMLAWRRDLPSSGADTDILVAEVGQPADFARLATAWENDPSELKAGVVASWVRHYVDALREGLESDALGVVGGLSAGRVVGGGGGVGGGRGPRPPPRRRELGASRRRLRREVSGARPLAGGSPPPDALTRVARLHGKRRARPPRPMMLLFERCP